MALDVWQDILVRESALYEALLEVPAQDSTPGFVVLQPPTQHAKVTDHLVDSPLCPLLALASSVIIHP